MRQFFVVNSFIIPSILVSIISTFGLCAERPDSFNKRTSPMRSDIREINNPLSSIGDAKKAFGRIPKEQKALLTKGEVEEIETLRRVAEESNDSLLSYQLGKINLSEAKTKKTDPTKPSHASNHSVKRDFLLSPDHKHLAKNKEPSIKTYKKLQAEEKELVDSLCQEGVDELLNQYTRNLIATIKSKRTILESERVSFVLASQRSEIQLEPFEIEKIQLNALKEEAEINFMQEEYNQLSEKFWADAMTIISIRTIAIDALQTFDISNEDDIASLVQRFNSEAKGATRKN